MRSWMLVSCFVLCAGSTSALEGKLPQATADKISGYSWNLTYTNANCDAIVKAINSWNMLKVTIDAELLNVVVPSIKLENRNVIVACDEFAKIIGAKAFAQGDGIHISRKGAPAGGQPAGGGVAGPGPGPAAGPGPGPAPMVAGGGINWTGKNQYACKVDRKPVVLFYYDKAAKPTDTILNFFNNSLFMDPNVEKLLADFTCVKLDTSNTIWPKDMSDRGKGSAAVFLLTCEGTPLAAYDKNSGVPTVKAFLDAAQRAAAENAKIAEKLAKDDKAKQDQEEKDTKKSGTGIPGLDKKTEEKSADPAKSKTSAKVEDEK
ncbi:MAG: hypothetical protein HY291_07810 [Planctomycetes bacterium]|nr:hypothetical protein [Planctomycetota bacterium]